MLNHRISGSVTLQNTAVAHEGLRLPITTAPDLYRKGFADALSEFCTPLDEAKAGDFVAAGRELILSEADASSVLTDVFVQISDNTGTSIAKFEYQDAPREIRNIIAPGAMLAQYIGIGMDSLSHATSSLDTRRVDILFAPDFLLAASAYHKAILDRARRKGSVTQEVIDQCFLVILPKRIQSAHEAVEFAPIAEKISQLAKTYFPAIAEVCSDQALPLDTCDIYNASDA
jgi:hypothetical protein